MNVKSPYLGSRINLVSKSEIRYEGTLFGVDSQASTISLSKVRSFGTEDRPAARYVKAREEVFEYVIFKATDIKDLVVMEDVKPSELTNIDPAIVSMAKSPRPLNDQRSGYFNHSSQRARQQQYYPLAFGADRYSQKQNQHFHVAPKDKLKFENDYDYVKANEQFEKTLNTISEDMKDKVVIEAEKLEADGENTEEKPIEEKESKSEEEPAFYNKKASFFDEISCEALEKAEGKYNRPNWRKERQTNQETFGPYAVRNQSQYGQRRPNQQSRFVPNRAPRFFDNCASTGIPRSFRPKVRSNNYIHI